MIEVINKGIRDFSKEVDIIQTMLIFFVALLAPTFLGQLIKSVFGATSVITQNSQIIVGSVVNTALIITAINIKGWKKNSRNYNNAKYIYNIKWICF